MKTIRISATNARNNFFTLLNRVLYEDVNLIIEKAGTDKVAVVSSTKSFDLKKNERLEALKKTYGALRDVPMPNFVDDRIREERAKAYLDNLRKAW